MIPTSAARAAPTPVMTSTTTDATSQRFMGLLLPERDYSRRVPGARQSPRRIMPRGSPRLRERGPDRFDSSSPLVTGPTPASVGPTVGRTFGRDSRVRTRTEERDGGRYWA